VNHLYLSHLIILSQLLAFCQLEWLQSYTNFKLSRDNYEDLCHFLYNSNFISYLMSEDIEFVWSYFSNLIRDALPHFFSSTVIKSNSQPVWFNPGIRHHINCLHTLRRKFINNPTEHNKNKLDSSQKLLQAKIMLKLIMKLILSLHLTILIY